MNRLAVAFLICATLAGCAGAGSATYAPLSATLRDFKIEPSQLSAGTPLTIAVTSNGPTPHNFTIRDSAGTVIVASTDLRTGETDTVEVPGLAPGEYTFFCSFAGHESLGMRGTFTVTQ
jgi:plastocyanin